MSHAHAVGDVVRRMDQRGSGARDVNWLAATVRHEIAHAVDASIPAVVHGFTAGVGGWWTGAEPSTEADFDTWVAAMGATAWSGATSGAAGHTTPITSSGHAAAAPTSAESHIFSRGLVGPKSATTAHPNRADMMLPRERLMSARTAWMITMRA